MEVVGNECCCSFPHKKDLWKGSVCGCLGSVCVRNSRFRKNLYLFLACHRAQELRPNFRQLIPEPGLYPRFCLTSEHQLRLAAQLSNPQPPLIKTEPYFPICPCFLIFQSLPWALMGSNNSLCTLQRDITRLEFRHLTVTQQTFPLGCVMFKQWPPRSGKIEKLHFQLASFLKQGSEKSWTITNTWE